MSEKLNTVKLSHEENGVLRRSDVLTRHLFTSQVTPSLGTTAAVNAFRNRPSSAQRLALKAWWNQTWTKFPNQHL